MKSDPSFRKALSKELYALAQQLDNGLDLKPGGKLAVDAAGQPSFSVGVRRHARGDGSKRALAGWTIRLRVWEDSE